MRYVMPTLLILCSGILLASPLDTWHLYRAQQYTQQQQYSKARAEYVQVKPQTDKLRYNQGNLLYREKQYAQAITAYTQIDTPALMHAKFHNIGNCLMHLGETATAIVFYRNALKFLNHPDTQQNLTLAQTRLAEEIKKEKERELKESRVTLTFRDGFNLIDRFKEDNGTADLKDAKTPKNPLKRINSTATTLTRDSSIIETNSSRENNSSQEQNSTQKSQQPDTYSAQFWKSFFHKRPLKTLLIPLNTQGVSRDQNTY